MNLCVFASSWVLIMTFSILIGMFSSLDVSSIRETVRGVFMHPSVNRTLIWMTSAFGIGIFILSHGYLFIRYGCYIGHKTKNANFCFGRNHVSILLIKPFIQLTS